MFLKEKNMLNSDKYRNYHKNTLKLHNSPKLCLEMHKINMEIMEKVGKMFMVCWFTSLNNAADCRASDQVPNGVQMTHS